MLVNRTTATLWRVLTAARVFSLATGLGLAAITGEVPGIAAAFLALCVLAAVMSIPARASALQAVAPIAEGALVALVLVSLGHAVTPLLVYLVIPALVAGLQVGGKWPIVVTAAECLAAISAVLTTDQLELTGSMLERTAPWMLAGLGLGLLGSWMRASGGSAAAEQAGYESAHRLLGQLRAVSRRLPAGLDTSALAHEILDHSRELSGARRAVILVRDDHAFRTLANSGEPFNQVLEHDSTVEDCWHSGQTRRRPLEGGDHCTNRIALPLRIGSRLIGVMVADTTETVGKGGMSSVRAYLDEHSLRLEAALLFDEIRSTASLEERSRLAREIHDGVAQEIASLGYLVDDLAAVCTGADGRDAVRALRSELSRVVSELRLSIFDLRSNVNQHAGLGLVLSDYAREVGKRAGMTVHLALSEQPQRLHLNVETELLRIAQEAITNARKHAKANNLWVTLNTESPIIMLRVEDDGIGSVQPRDDHYGLRMMHERAERIGAELMIAPRPRGGTSVMVTAATQPTSSTGVRHDDLSPTR